MGFCRIHVAAQEFKKTSVVESSADSPRMTRLFVSCSRSQKPCQRSIQVAQAVPGRAKIETGVTEIAIRPVWLQKVDRPLRFTPCPFKLAQTEAKGRMQSQEAAQRALRRTRVSGL